VVVIGAGSVGVRVTQTLAERGREIVVVERDPTCRHVEALRSRGHHVIIADATVEASLDLAGVDRAAAVLALTDADAVNLLVLLALRRRAPHVPVVLRLNSRELSMHVASRGGAFAASPIEISSEEFARAALGACGRTAS
jgi:voltage-gated potassium channel